MAYYGVGRDHFETRRLRMEPEGRGETNQPRKCMPRSALDRRRKTIAVAALKDICYLFLDCGPSGGPGGGVSQ